MTEPIQGESPTLIEHIELCFGRIQHGFNTPTTGGSLDEVQFVECRGGFARGASVVCTLGLSRFALASTTSKKEIRQELFFMAKEDQLPGNTAAVLRQVVSDLTLTNSAVLRGHAIKRPGPCSTEEILSHSTAPCPFTTRMKCGRVGVKALKFRCPGSCQ